MPYASRSQRTIVVGQSRGGLLTGLILGVALAHPAIAQEVGRNASITFHLSFLAADGKRIPPSISSPVVVWLSPVGVEGQTDLNVKPGTGKSFQMIQKDKMFQPHLLVVPTGSLVAFPNRDPFFHNVFSLFNGRRFDLGLYETGASHSVPFNREGISYIFCNIHPEMGAIIVSVATPWFVSASQSSVQLNHLPAGEYRLNVWAENATPDSLKNSSRPISISAGDQDGGNLDIALQPPHPHTDKFGKSYSKHPEGSPY